MHPADPAPPAVAPLPKRQRFRPVPWTLAALLLAALAQSNLARGAAAEGALWYALAGLALLRGRSLGPRTADAPLIWRPPAPLALPSLLLMAAGLFGMAAGGWRLAAGDRLFLPALGMLLAGLVALLAGTAGAGGQRKPKAAVAAADLWFPDPSPPIAPPSSPARPAWAWWAALAAITALALALRLIWLDRLPFGIWFDEATIGLEAGRAAHTPDFRPLYSQGTSSPAVFIYAVAASLGLFGQEAGALRLVSALAGALTAPAFGLLLRELTGPRAALAGALLMAVARWDLTFSRLAMQGVTAPLAACLLLWLLLSGLRRGSLVRLALAGAVLGFGLLFYTAFFIAPLLALGLLALAWPAARQQWRGAAAGIAVFLATAAAATAPLASFAQHHPDLLFNRPAAASLLAHTTSAGLPATLADGLGKHLGMFQFRGDRNGRHNLPGEPMLDPLSGGAMALGLALALARPLAPAHGLALLWLALGLTPGVLSLPFEAPQGLRSILALPAALLLATLGLAALGQTGAAALGPARRGALRGAAAVVLAGAGAWNVALYFGPQAADYEAWAAHSTAETVVGRRLRDLPPERAAVLISGLFQQHPSIAFLNPAGAKQAVFDLATGLPLRSDAPQTVLFLEPRDAVAVDRLRRLYPNAACERISNRPQATEAVMQVCTVPQADIAATHGVELRVAQRDGAAAAGVTPDVALTWAPGGPFAGPLTAAWAGTLDVPTAGRYRLRAAGSVPLEVQIDHASVLSGLPGGAADVMLAQGLHALSATTVATTAEGAVALEWQPPGAGWEPVPATALLRPPVTAVGLTGAYYPNPAWSGPPALRRVDAGVGYYWHLTPLPRPYSVEWTGALIAPTAGRYQLGLRAVSAATLELDGAPLVTARQGQGDQLAAVELQAGPHPIRVRFVDQDGYSQVYLTWVPPGGRHETVPPEALRPW